jgi:hypothetical protein
MEPWRAEALTIEAWRLKMEPWRDSKVDQWSQICITTIRSRIQIQYDYASAIK